MARDPVSTSGGGVEPINVNYTVETQNRPNNAGSTKMAMALTKPAMMGAGILALGTAALGVFDIFRVPGLEDQIKELEAEVDRLEGEIDRLSGLNDDYEDLNELLEDEVAELALINDELNATTTDLEGQVKNLTIEVVELNETTQELYTRGEDLEELNQELNQTQVDLKVEIDELQGLETSLNETNELLKDRIEDLEDTVDDLNNVTQGLNQSIIQLDATIDDVTQLNSNLEEAIEALTDVSDFMNNVHSGYEESLSSVLLALRNSVNQRRGTVFLGLFNYYADIINNWDCINKNLFGQDAFFKNQSASIIGTSGPSKFGDLTETLKERQLVLMCTTELNFIEYLTYRFGAIGSITYDNMLSAASEYGGLAMAHYGLPRGTCTTDDCVSEEEWEEGEFDCNNVENFVWTAPP